ncbi:hypothetical protein OSCI_780038 [Kamptonema sp. PCC 6506]|nr:hypothetical protein OSCI_780038 [Kamptonema sp. PCC 6506]
MQSRKLDIMYNYNIGSKVSASERLQGRPNAAAPGRGLRRSRHW